MKKLILFASLLFAVNAGIFAQNNPFTPASGALATASIGVAYNQDITFTIPNTVTIDPASLGVPLPLPPFDATVDTVKFTVVGLVSGLTATFDNGTGIYFPGGPYTLTISGTPTANPIDTVTITSLTSGSGTLVSPLGSIPVTFPGNVMGQSVPAAPQVFDGGPYTMNTVGVQELNFSKFDVIQNIPNPFTGNTTIKFSMPTAGNIEFTVFDMIGKRVHAEKLQAQAKTNSINFSSEKLAPGTYFYSLSNGSKTITKKMIVAGR